MIDKCTIKNKLYTSLNKPLLGIAFFSVLLIIVFVLFYTFKSLDHIIAFNGYAANGAFQLMNPLERMANGEILGKDYQYFHGPGIVLAHFPLFTLFGGGLFGSEISRYFTSIFLFCATALVFYLAWFKGQNNKYEKTLLAFSLALVLTSLTAEVITPSNSLLGVRTSMPIFIAALILFRPANIFTFLKYKVRIFDIIMPFLLALAIAFGTEQGIAAFIAYAIIESIFLFTEKKNNLSKRLACILIRLASLSILTIIFVFLLFAIISLGHPLPALQYVLLDVPNEQFWYFGGEPQGFLTYGNILKNMSSGYLLLTYALAVIAALSLYFTHKKNVINRNQLKASIFLLLYGTVALGSVLSYFYPTQAVPLARTTTLVIAALLASIASYILCNQNKKLAQYTKITICVVLLVVSCLVVNKTLQFQLKHLSQTTFSTINDPNRDYNILGPWWQNQVNAFKPELESNKDKPVPLWSTYASIYEPTISTTQPSSQGHDYIIHALGPDRRNQYAQDFIDLKPELATTLRESYFIFEEWLWSRHWDFYLPLIENYKIIEYNDSHFLWKRTSPIQNSTEKRNLEISGNQISLPDYGEAQSELIEVSVTYSVESLWNNVPYAKKLPRYMVRPQNTVNSIGISLPPYENKWIFPIVLDKDKTDPSLVFSADGLLPGAKLNIIKAEYRPIKTLPENMVEFTERYGKQ